MIFHECGAPILAEVQTAGHPALIKLYDAGKYGGKPVGTFCPVCHKPIGDKFKTVFQSTAHPEISASF